MVRPWSFGQIRGPTMVSKNTKYTHLAGKTFIKYADENKSINI